MYRLFESLLAIETLAELKLTLYILAKDARSGEDCPAVTYAEFQSATGFSPTTVARGLSGMQTRGYILRSSLGQTSKKQPSQYHVLWDRLGMAAGVKAFATPPTHALPSSNAAIPASSAEFYFTATGFLDLLPQARDIARSLGYGEDEIIHAVGLVFDKQRVTPPTINRTGWFITVFTEKIKEAHAEILAYRQRNKHGVRV